MRIDSHIKDYYSYDVDSFLALPALQYRLTYLFVDIDLLNASIFWITNKERIKYNLPQFKYHKKLNEMATIQSNQMRIHNFFAHENPFDAKYKTLRDRLNAVKDKHFYGFNCFAENIADVPIIMANVRFFTEQRQGVTRFVRDNGTEVLPYTYIEYANTVVDAWMNSPGHCANILNPDYVYLGCGCAKYEKKEPNYSMLYFKLTQNFGGEELFDSIQYGISGIKKTIQIIKKKLE